ncbi:MAG: hypothetical protein JRJ85_28880, partial [Deltaproteobacteria bacterium]|nr:hypothetical protein [Deltaproteobacteria bacterium]
TTGAAVALYAATHTGLFRSLDFGVNWTPRTAFTENNINTLAIHPSATGAGTDVLYAGTENAWVWVSSDSGNTWPTGANLNPYSNGMGEGLSASTPVADVDNTGNGFMSDVTVFTETQSEFWSVTCTAELPDSGIFSVEGSVSGPQGNATVGTEYTSPNNRIRFTISDGSVDFKVGDFYTFTTIRDPGRTIKDLLVDDQNDRLYAITYYYSPIEPYHAVGNVYQIQLDPVTHLPTGNWTEANTGLPQFEPPNDTTLFAQYVMATDDEANPGFFLIGGEGINMYRATDGFGTGAPAWEVSKTGLTNLIMARMPIL